MPKAIFNWSGGKDSALCLYHILKDEQVDIQSLVTTINHEKDRISMHGVRTSLLDEQAKSIDLPLKKIHLSEMPSMDEYNQKMKTMLEEFKNLGVTQSIFGDIFLEDLKQYRDEKLAQVGIKGVFPLWKRDTGDLMHEFIDQGFRSVVVCVNANHLDDSFLGRELDLSFMNDLPEDVDVCGENGEFHTFVYDGPIFTNPISFVKGEKVFKEYAAKGQKDQSHDTGFWYLDLLDE